MSSPFFFAQMNFAHLFLSLSLLHSLEITVSNFNARDVGTIAGTTALSAPVGHLIGERMREEERKKRRIQLSAVFSSSSSFFRPPPFQPCLSPPPPPPPNPRHSRPQEQDPAPGHVDRRHRRRHRGIPAVLPGERRSIDGLRAQRQGGREGAAGQALNDEDVSSFFRLLPRLLLSARFSSVFLLHFSCNSHTRTHTHAHTDADFKSGKEREIN